MPPVNKYCIESCMGKVPCSKGTADTTSHDHNICIGIVLQGRKTPDDSPVEKPVRIV
jgi:hypothetical protein